ncbi:hypothetical protein CR513_42602, partial [Mucuna pruriens]
MEKKTISTKFYELDCITRKFPGNGLQVWIVRGNKKIAKHCYELSLNISKGKVFEPKIQVVVVFNDDILVYSHTHDEHEHLKVLLEVLKEKNLYAKFSKCEFWLEKVNFLGHVISIKGIIIDSTKVDAML